MNEKITQAAFPLDIEISFKKLFESYRASLNSASPLVQARAKEILKVEKDFPELSEGLTSQEDMERLQPQIDIILEDMFASVLQKNEIKVATIPFSEFIFKSTERYDNIVKVAGPGFDLQLSDFDDDQFYIMGCSVILNAYYGYRADFRRPFYYDIPDDRGIMRHYRVLYNGDFIEIEKTEHSIEITPEDVAELLDNFENIDLWKEKFPPGSWKFSGFVIANMYDATTDVALSDFKANLLQIDEKDENFAIQFQNIVRAIFNLPSLVVGYSIFNAEDSEFEHPPELIKVKSYVLNGEKNEKCTKALCPHSYAQLIEEHKPYCISDVDRYHNLYPENVLYQKLHMQGVKSAIITPITSEGIILGMLEIVSPNPQELNSINAHKLEDIMPFLADSVRRSKELKENEMELLIQQECTSIHPSVHWKFKKEAERVIKSKFEGEEVTFNEIVFENVYPLFGQIDIKGSSVARNLATRDDLILQLKHVKKIIDKIYKIEPLPIYEQINFRINGFLTNIEQHLQVDSERRVLNFLRNEIVPLYDHLSKKNDQLKSLIADYYKQLDVDKGFIYKHRKDYDESVMLINKTMAGILDKKQETAQQMYPHYYERFKTDGVEHNLYIGESITKQDSFNKIYLYNLRLWQLQAMCEMENSFYQLKEKLLVPLDVASMILAFNSSLSLRFRMDEKRFDVDGTYNARYEVVKKRVDKAHIKGTDERITQPGKIAIVYSQKSDEQEYLKYINFLQSKRQLGDNLEILELEDLQGVTGLRAIRINVLYNRGEKDKEYYTYEDLMKEISN
ncbi:MAG: GAF domain-containing protein [Bacteroidota bacterium]